MKNPRKEDVPVKVEMDAYRVLMGDAHIIVSK